MSFLSFSRFAQSQLRPGPPAPRPKPDPRDLRAVQDQWADGGTEYPILPATFPFHIDARLCDRLERVACGCSSAVGADRAGGVEVEHGRNFVHPDGGGNGDGAPRRFDLRAGGLASALAPRYVSTLSISLVSKGKCKPDTTPP